MIENELATIVNDVCCNWLISGQDLLCRSALLREELAESAKRKYLHVLIVPEESMTFVTSILAENSSTTHWTLPAYSYSYFPVFTPVTHEERMSRFLKLLRLHGMSESEINRANEYLNFICSLDRLSCSGPISLTSDLIDKYASISAVETVLNNLVNRNIVSRIEYHKLLEKYSEVSSIAPVIENLIGSMNNSFF